MSAAATLTLEAPPAAPAGARGEAVTERHLAMLDRLAEAAMKIALALEAQAEGGPAVVEGDVVMAFDRAARALRQTLMLRAKLADERMEGAARKSALRAGAARLVRGAIEDETRGDKDRSERLRAGAAERLRSEDFGDLLSRPFNEAVAGICRDLGLSPDWLSLAEDCFDIEAALRAKPGKEPVPPDEDVSYEVQWLDSNQRPYTPRRASDSS